MRTMYDAVTPQNIPANAEIVAGYVEGRYVWSTPDWMRFPNSVKVTIAIWSADADVLDIETGDATPAMGPAWVARQRARGAFPTVYCNLSTWPAVQSALAGAGFVNGQHYDWWAAHYTGVPHLVPGAAACQYADPGPVDLSLCQDHWPRHAPVQPPPPAWRYDVPLIVHRISANPDAHGLDAVYSFDFINKVYVGEGALAVWAAQFNPPPYTGQFIPMPGEFLDRYEEETGIPMNQGKPAFDPSAMEAKLDSLLQAVTEIKKGPTQGA